MHTLFYSPGACSMAVHIVLEEIGKPYGLQLVSTRPDAEGLKTVSEDWQKLNPKGRVPALSGVPGRIGGETDLLTEANAIMIYLARTNPDCGLLPGDPVAEARMVEWLNWLTGTVHAVSFGMFMRPHRFTDDEALHETIKNKGRKSYADNLLYIESLLADGRDWAVPGGYSLVDPYLLVFYNWARFLKLDRPALYPAWTAQARKVAARPAVARVLEAEGQPFP